MNIEFIEEEHRYLVDGVEVPSVTTILDYITCGHYATINPSILDRAKARGTAVHEATQMVDYGCEPEVDGEIVGFVKGYLDFIRDYFPKWEMIEKPMYNGEWGYCGTVDRFGYIDRKPCVVDIKTTSSPNKLNYISLCCQTRAYAMALGEDDARRYGLFLKSDGTYRLVDCEKYEEKQGFSSMALFSKCIELYTMVKEIKEKKNGK